MVVGPFDSVSGHHRLSDRVATDKARGQDMADAYLLDWGMDWEIIDDESHLQDEYILESAPDVTALECVRSYDHGARTSEELDMDRCAEGAAWIMGPVLTLMECPWWRTARNPHMPTLAYDLAMAHIVDDYGLERSDYSGLWHCDDPDEAQWLYELWDYCVEPALGDVGFIVETSSDAGMTWIYRPTGEGE